MANPQQISAALDVVKAIAAAIKEAKRIPSGHLYAVTMGTLSPDQYQSIVNLLKRAKLVDETGAHELVWIGPIQ